MEFSEVVYFDDMADAIFKDFNSSQGNLLYRLMNLVSGDELNGWFFTMPTISELIDARYLYTHMLKVAKWARVYSHERAENNRHIESGRFVSGLSESDAWLLMSSGMEIMPRISPEEAFRFFSWYRDEFSQKLKKDSLVRELKAAEVSYRRDPDNKELENKVHELREALSPLFKLKKRLCYLAALFGYFYSGESKYCDGKLSMFDQLRLAFEIHRAANSHAYINRNVHDYHMKLMERFDVCRLSDISMTCIDDAIIFVSELQAQYCLEMACDMVMSSPAIKTGKPDKSRMKEQEKYQTAA